MRRVKHVRDESSTELDDEVSEISKDLGGIPLICRRFVSNGGKLHLLACHFSGARIYH